MKRVIFWIGITTITFWGIDWVWLSSLPSQNISYGYTNPAWLIFSIGRIILGLFCFLLWLLFSDENLHVSEFRRKVSLSSITSKMPFFQYIQPICRFLHVKPVFLLWGLLGLEILILLIGFYGFGIEPFWIQTTYLTISPAQLVSSKSKNYLNDNLSHLNVQYTSLGNNNSPKQKTRGIRIVQLSDFHVETTTRRERDLPELVNNLHPDIIVLTGDYISSDNLYNPRSQRALSTLFDQLNATQGIYAVRSSTDDPIIMKNIFKGTRVQTLDDEIQSVNFPGGLLYIIGVTVGRDRIRDSTMVEQLKASLPDNAPTILLYHTPDIIGAARASGIDLYLAGHTHGGQVRLPFIGAIFTNASYGALYDSGLFKLGRTNLYVNRGLGMAGNHVPRARFLCRPEVLVIDIDYPSTQK